MDRCIRCGKRLARKSQLFCSKNCRYRYEHGGNMVLSVTGKCLEMLLSGDVKEVCKDITPYWTKRFENYFGRHYNTGGIRDGCGDVPALLWDRQEKTVIFRNGFKRDAPELTAVCTISEGYKEGCGDDRCYILTIRYIVKGSLKTSKKPRAKERRIDYV